MFHPVAATVPGAATVLFVYFDVVGVKVAKTPFCFIAIVLVN